MFIKIIKKIINSFLSIFNLKLNKIKLSNDFFYYISRTLIHFKINVLLDVGANSGQFAEKIIEYGYKKKIISFEPMSKAHRELVVKSKKYKNWEIFKRVGIGEKKGVSILNISKNSVSSSVLQMNKRHLVDEPNARYVSKETINLISLNDVFKNNFNKKQKIFLKVDTQGFEKKIIKGASKVLNRIQCIMLETSIIPMYKGEDDYIKIIKYMKKKNFYVWSIERGFSNKKNGRVNQLDIIFVNGKI